MSTPSELARSADVRSTTGCEQRTRGEDASARNVVNGPVIDMDTYTPALITWLANKLSASASSLYLDAFGIGVIEWRIMATLAGEPEISGARICHVVGLDKAAVSRGFLKLSKAGLIDWRGTERLRLAALSPAGRRLHDKVVPVALERERRLLEGLTQDQRAVLVSTLHKLLDNLSLVNDFKLG